MYQGTSFFLEIAICTVFSRLKRSQKPKIFSEIEHAPYRPVRLMCG